MGKYYNEMLEDVSSLIDSVNNDRETTTTSNKQRVAHHVHGTMKKNHKSLRKKTYVGKSTISIASNTSDLATIQNLLAMYIHNLLFSH